jgi:hypothetical protein
MAFFERFFSSFSLEDLFKSAAERIEDRFDTAISTFEDAFSVFGGDDSVFIDATETPMDLGFETLEEEKKREEITKEIEEENDFGIKIGFKFGSESMFTENPIVGNDIFGSGGTSRIIQKMISGQEVTAMDFLE